MRFDRAATVALSGPLHRAGLVRASSAIPVLMYHSVSDDPERGIAPYYRVTTSPRLFRRQMQWIRDRGYRVIDLAEAVRRLNDGHADSRSVVLTFDDGFRDFYTHAWPVMADFDYTATMFLPTGYIDAARRTFKGRECLTWDEVRELRARGMAFGAHTVTHPELYRLSWADIRRELRDSRIKIEEALGAPVDFFAYPYAFPQEDRAFVERFGQELVVQGYAGGVTTIIGRASRSSNRLCVPRLPINGADDESLFANKLAGAYDWMGAVQFAFRRARNRPPTAKSA